MSHNDNVLNFHKTSLRVLCPVFYDVESFIELKKDILKNVPSHIESVKFTIVDDTAGEDPQVNEFLSNDQVEVITPPYNLGHQRAIVYGLRHTLNSTNEDLICIMDSDGEDQPSDLSRLLEGFDNNHRFVLAKRTKRREKSFFKIMYFFYKILFKLLTGRIIQTGNYVLAEKESLKKIIHHPYFDLCFSSTFLALKLPRRLIPCERGVRYKGQSKMNSYSLIMHGIRMLMPFLDIIAIRSLVTFSLAFASGLVLAGLIVGIKLFTSHAIPGWASFLCAITLTFSFIALGNFLILFATFTESHGAAQRELTKEINQTFENSNKEAA